MIMKPAFQSLVILCGVLILSCFLGMPAPGYGQEKAQLLNLEPVPDLLTVPGQVARESDAVKRFAYDGKGRVDRIEGDEIVINDTLRFLSGNVRYSTPSGMSVTRRDINRGAWVGYRVDETFRIVEIHLLSN